MPLHRLLSGAPTSAETRDLAGEDSIGASHVRGGVTVRATNPGMVQSQERRVGFLGRTAAGADARGGHLGPPQLLAESVQRLGWTDSPEAPEQPPQGPVFEGLHAALGGWFKGTKDIAVKPRQPAAR